MVINQLKSNQIINQTITNQKDKNMVDQMDNDKDKDKDFIFEIVNDNEMEFTSRGRKSNISDSQLKLVADQVKKSPNKFIRISSYGMPKDLTEVKTQKNYKASVSSTIRLMGKKLGYKTEIRWDINNIPCVLFTKAITK